MKITERSVEFEGRREESENCCEARAINDRLREMMDEAPSDASAQLIVREVGPGKFRGFLTVSSSQRMFVGGGMGTRLREAVNLMFDEVTRQIQSWKRTRFAGDGPSDY